MIEILIAILFGVVEGITEWLPISSTGHMILLDEFVHLNTSDTFKELFLVVIQLGAILAVIILFWKKIFPFGYDQKVVIKKDIFSMWFKIIVASIPAALIGIPFSDKFDELFYNYTSVAIALFVFGILFLYIEDKHKGKPSKINSLTDITYSIAFIIGIWQLVAAVFPGTSRSGATIIGALLLGLSRTVAAEFTFFLAIPAMLGASLIKILKFGFAFTGTELAILLVGTGVSFLVSIFVIQFLMGYIKKHDFKVFGWYRIILAIIVLGYYCITQLF